MSFISCIILYSLGRPNLIFFEGIPPQIRYLGPFLEILGLASFFYCLSRCKGWKSRLLIGYCFSLGSAILTFNGFWLGVDKLTGFSLLPRVVIFLAFGLIQYPHLLVLSVIFPFVQSLKISRVVLVTSLISIIEWFNPGLDTIQIGQTWIEYAPNINLASYFGLAIYTFFNLMIAWMLFKKVSTKYLVLISLLFIGVNLRNREGIQKGSKILLVQTNHPPYTSLAKAHGRERAFKIIDDSISTAVGDITEVNYDLAILAETTYPLPLDSNRSIISQVEQFETIKRLINKKVMVGFGAPTEGKHDHFKRYYNSFWVIGQEKDQRYDKRVLMPLAESPLPFIGEDLTNSIMPRGDYTVPGDNLSTLSLANKEQFLVDICFDGDVPHQMRNKILSNPKVDFIINVANDSWFNPSSQADVHLWRTRWMSALFEVPTARVSNGGISASIKWDGSIAEYIPNGEAGSKEVQLWYPVEKNSFFTKWGIFPFIILSFFIWGILEIKSRCNKNP